MKVVLDTNVFVSGVFFKGPPYQILKAWREGKVAFVISAEIFDEYRRVAGILSRKYASLDLQKILAFIEREVDFVEAKSLPEQITNDPDDEKFIECAISCDVKIIVSGDKHLLDVSGYQGIDILTPRTFVDQYLYAD